MSLCRVVPWLMRSATAEALSAYLYIRVDVSTWPWSNQLILPAWRNGRLDLILNDSHRLKISPAELDKTADCFHWVVLSVRISFMCSLFLLFEAEFLCSSVISSLPTLGWGGGHESWGHVASAKREPIMEPRAEPTAGSRGRAPIGRSRGQNPLKLKAL